MGLSSSQARLLNLTARMHQIEYNAARIEAMKLQMANESRRVYEDYLDALDKNKIQIKTLTTNGAVTFIDLTDYTQFVESGFVLVVHGTSEGQTVCHDDTELIEAIKEIYTGEDGEELDISEGLLNNFETTLTNLINSGQITILEKPQEGKVDEEDLDEYGFPIYGTNAYTDYETSVATNTKLQETQDEVELRKAEAKYEADMKRIDMKDRRYDTELAALDNERNAVKQEMETLKTVAKDNVDRTFRLFS